MPIDTMARPTASPPPRRRSRWTPVEQLPLFGRELGRDDSLGYTRDWRLSVGRVHEWDDRLETTVYSTYRLLVRRAHGQGSARFALSQQQIIDSPLAAKLGWHRRVERGRVRYFFRDGVTEMTATATLSASQRFFRAHRRDLLRILDVMQDIGLIRHWPERDAQGELWYRTVIELVDVDPITDKELLRKVRRRKRGFRARRRRYQLRTRYNAAGELQEPRTPRLSSLLAHAHKPSKETRRRLAVARAARLRERDRHLEVEHAILLISRDRVIAEAEAITAAAAAADEHRADPSGDITHPFGAPPTGEPSAQPRSMTITDALRIAEAQAVSSPVQALNSSPPSAAELGAREADRVRATIVLSFAELPASERTRALALLQAAGADVDGRGPCGALCGGDPILLDRIAAQLRRRAEIVRSAPVRGRLPYTFLRDAWGVARHGVDALLTNPELRPNDDGIGIRSPRLHARLRRAIAIYDEFADERPPGWPATGAGALLRLAADPLPYPLLSDITRLLKLARDMRALALHNDPTRLARATRRASRRAEDHAPRRQPDVGLLRFDYRAEAPPSEVRGGADKQETRRIAERDRLLRVSQHPGLSDAAFNFADEHQERQLAVARRQRRREDAMDSHARYLHWQQLDAARARRIERGVRSGYDVDELRSYLPDGMTERALRYQHQRANGQFS